MEYSLEGRCVLEGGPTENELMNSLFSRESNPSVVTFEIATPDGTIFFKVYITMLKQDQAEGRESWWHFEGHSQSKRSWIYGGYSHDPTEQCGEVVIKQICY
jgi:hypothetical protein